MPYRKIAEWGWAMVPFAVIVGVIVYLHQSFEAVKQSQRALMVRQEQTRQQQFAELANRLDAALARERGQ